MKVKNPTGATPLDPEILEQLIPNLTTQDELNEFEAQNIGAAIIWARASSDLRKNLLTATGLIKLHRKMFDQTWEWAGKWRWLETNIGVAPKNIQNELGALLGDVQYWLEHKTYSTEEAAVRFHHKLVWTHPFPNGNGRFSRLAADLLIEFNGGKKLSWGSRDLVGETKTRDEYLRSLRIADRSNDYEALLKFARS